VCELGSMTKDEAVEPECALGLRIAPSGAARTIRDQSMSFRDKGGPALSWPVNIARAAPRPLAGALDDGKISVSWWSVGEQMGSDPRRNVLQRDGFRTLSNPPSPLGRAAAQHREFAFCAAAPCYLTTSVPSIMACFEQTNLYVPARRGPIL
jgi:hypothetical protein